MQEIRIPFLGWEDSLEEAMATHSSILACGIPWTEEPGGLPSMHFQRIRHDWATNTHWTQLLLEHGQTLQPASRPPVSFPEWHNWIKQEPSVLKFVILPSSELKKWVNSEAPFEDHPIPRTPTPSTPYLSDPLLPFLSKFRRAGVHQAGIECPGGALPGGKRQHGQGGGQESKCPSLENGQPGGGERRQLPTSPFNTGLSLAPAEAF